MNNTFIVRVELHNALEADYQTLHAEMAKLGFSRTVTGANGTRFQLPTAEYVIATSINTVALRDNVKRAANTTGKSSWVIVTQSNGMAWELQQL